MQTNTNDWQSVPDKGIVGPRTKGGYCQDQSNIRLGMSFHKFHLKAGQNKWAADIKAHVLKWRCLTMCFKLEQS